MARNYAALPHEYLEEMEMLSDAEFGRLCRALLRYSRDRETPTLSGNERIIFPRVRMQEDRFQASYDEICNRNKNNGQRGGRPKKGTEPTGTQTNPEKPTGTQKTNINTNTNINTEIKAKTEETEEKKRPSCARACATDSDGAAFDTFWAAYPRKVGKEAARKAFSKLQNVDLKTLLQAIETQKQSAQWRRENGRYIPNPATWLNEGRWEDEYASTDLDKWAQLKAFGGMTRGDYEYEGDDSL